MNVNHIFKNIFIVIFFCFYISFMSLISYSEKIIFYDYACLEHYENITFITNSPTKHETVIDTFQLNIPTDSSYYTILKNGDGYDFIFRNKRHWNGGSTCFYNTETKKLIL